MDFDLAGGKYVVAVSGGVDSVALLHSLLEKQHQTDRTKNTENDLDVSTDRDKSPFIGPTHFMGWTYKGYKAGVEGVKKRGYEFVVAHFDHGMRLDSAEDRKFVERLCKAYGVPFLYGNGHLGEHASEALARKARYDFLHAVRKAIKADAVITAHHQDDVLETIIINLLRGTHNRGLHSLKSTDVVKRPLTHISKQKIKTYAKLHGLKWRDDPTNVDTKYLRNHVRHNIVPKIGMTHRHTLLKHGIKAEKLQAEIDAHTAHVLHVQPHVFRLDRVQFVALPYQVACELMASWLRQRAGVELSKKLIDRLVVAAKTGQPTSEVDVAQGWRLRIRRNTIELHQVSLVS